MLDQDAGSTELPVLFEREQADSAEGRPFDFSEGGDELGALLAACAHSDTSRSGEEVTKKRKRGAPSFRAWRKKCRHGKPRHTCMCFRGEVRTVDEGKDDLTVGDQLENVTQDTATLELSPLADFVEQGITSPSAPLPLPLDMANLEMCASTALNAYKSKKDYLQAVKRFKKITSLSDGEALQFLRSFCGGKEEMHRIFKTEKKPRTQDADRIVTVSKLLQEQLAEQ